MQNVMLTFDGRSKNPKEVVEMIRPFLMTGREFKFIIPAQWEWDALSIFHPSEGMREILNNEDKVSKKYHISYDLQPGGQIAIIAIPR